MSTNENTEGQLQVDQVEAERAQALEAEVQAKDARIQQLEQEKAERDLLEARLIAEKDEAEERVRLAKEAIAIANAEALKKQEEARLAALASESEAQELHTLLIEEQTAANQMVKCGVFNAEGTLIRLCEVPASMVDLQANTADGETVRVGEFSFNLSDKVEYNWGYKRAVNYPPLTELADAQYHLLVNGDDSKLKAWAEKCKAVKDAIPKE